MYYIFIAIYLTHCISSLVYSTQISPDVCQYILKQARIADLSLENCTEETTYIMLKNFFEKRNIEDYKGVVEYSKSNQVFEHPDLFSQKLGSLFVEHKTDVLPEKIRNYQAIFFTTSGIDSFFERLAFLARLTKNKNLKTEKVVALIGLHPHRNDLKSYDYIMKLPEIFENDFDWNPDSFYNLSKKIDKLIQKNSWIHRDGMDVAWEIASCDTHMAHLREKFSYFSGNDNLRTEQLLKALPKILANPLDSSNPIAFILNAQESKKIIEMLKKIYSNHLNYIDIFIAKPIEVDKETQLFNDIPQQRALVKLYHLYRTLESKIL